MEKSIMKDVNFTYLGAILFLVAAIGAMSLYYQDTYGRIADKYETASEELEDSVVLVKEREAELNQRIAEANLARQREAVLSDRYNDLRSEKESLETELEKTQQELSDLQGDYNNLQDDLEVTQAGLKEAQDEISSLQGDVQSLYSEVLARNAIISSLIEQLDSCSQG